MIEAEYVKVGVVDGSVNTRLATGILAPAATFVPPLVIVNVAV
jgi:hypothetical protein